MGNFLPTDAFHADGPLLHGLFAIRARSAREPSSEAEPEPKWPNFRRSTQSNKHGQRARCSKCTYGLRISNASRSALEFLDGRNGGAKAEFLHSPIFEDLAILTHPVGRRSLSACGLSPLPRDTCSVSAVENEGRNFAMAPELECERFSLSIQVQGWAKERA